MGREQEPTKERRCPKSRFGWFVGLVPCVEAAAAVDGIGYGAFLRTLLEYLD
jgi:hypothetical protein